MRQRYTNNNDYQSYGKIYKLRFNYIAFEISETKNVSGVIGGMHKNVSSLVERNCTTKSENSNKT